VLRAGCGTHHGICEYLLRWWTGLSPRRRILLGAFALVVAAAAVVTGALASGGAPEAIPGRPGAVLLVPGYGGSATSLDELAARIRASGRTATVVALAGDGTGDLTVQARVLDGYVNRAVGAGSGPVTVIGYSAGGVVAWLWYVDYGGASRTSRNLHIVAGDLPVRRRQTAPCRVAITQHGRFLFTGLGAQRCRLCMLEREELSGRASLVARRAPVGGKGSLVAEAVAADLS
jgi:triacylglycerol esterase/lipase EstA (alpha/beta hydrolase family)